MSKRKNEDYYYYKGQLDKLRERGWEYPATIKIWNNGVETKYMSINKDSVNALVDFLNELGYNTIKGGDL